MTSTKDNAPPSAPLNSRLENADRPFRICLRDTLVVGNRQQLKMTVVDAIAGGHPHIVLDATGCGYIDASGLGVLVSVNKKAKEAGGSLVIEGLADDLLEYFKMLNLDTIFTMRSAPP